MSTLGYVIIVYNQASGWPEVENTCLYDDEVEAQEFAGVEEKANRANGRREKYRVARVELVGEDW